MVRACSTRLHCKASYARRVLEAFTSIGSWTSTGESSSANVLAAAIGLLRVDGAAIVSFLTTSAVSPTNLESVLIFTSCVLEYIDRPFVVTFENQNIS